VLSRERNNQKEILVNVKSNDSPSLPLHLRCIRTPEEEWTPAFALEDLTRNVEAELEGKILRFSLNLKGRLALEWSKKIMSREAGNARFWLTSALASVLSVRKRRKSALEDARIHAQHEQRCCLLGPDTQPLAEDRSRKHGSPNVQKHVSKPTGISTSGQKKEKIHKARPLNVGASGPGKLSSKQI
jgi:hypothetical protein